METDSEEKALEGVVLALAGLNRLWADTETQPILEKLLAGLRWMVLPLSENPTAPGQGALSIECRTEDDETYEAVSKIHSEVSASEIKSERKILADWGGGCHQRFGASETQSDVLGPILYIRGKKHDGHDVDETRWKTPKKTTGKVNAWDGVERRSNSVTRLEFQSEGFKTVFISHSRSLPEGFESTCQEARVWTSGIASWSRLAARGVWVEGCADHMGFSSLFPLLQTHVLRLPDFNQWTVLTHREGVSGWEKGKVLATYDVKGTVSPTSIEDLKKSTHIFWGSGSQFDLLRESIPEGAHHACGPGKTYQHLKKAGMHEVDAFPTVKEWRKWIQK